MTDITITAASVAPGSNSQQVVKTAGATITAGQAVYLAADGTVGLADSDSATAVVRNAYGVALNGASAGQPVSVHRGGFIDLGATLVVGTVYVVSTTAGGVAPLSDLGSGDYVSILGVAIAADEFDCKIHNSEVQVA